MNRALLLLFLMAIVSSALGVCTHAPGQHCVDLSWTASPTPSVTYNIYRGTVTGVCDQTLIGSGSASTSFADTAVTNGVTYFYAVSAADSGGESACTSEAMAVIPAGNPPSSPAGAFFAFIGQEPQLKTRPAVPVESIRPDPQTKHYKWLNRIARIGVGLAAAKIADDSVDGFVGPKKARYAGAAAFGLTEGIWWIVSARK